MSAVLFREGDDLDQLLADLDEEHPGGVRVVDVRYDREGGVLGFFARRRVAVSYTPAESALIETALIESALIEPEQTQPASSEASTGPASSDPVDDRAEFARMLLEMAAEKAARRPQEDEPGIESSNGFANPGGRHAVPETFEPAVVPPAAATLVPPAAPVPAPLPVATPVSPPAPGSPAAAPVTPAVAPVTPAAALLRPATTAPAAAPHLRRRLLDLGIPVGGLPVDVDDPVTAVRAAVAHVRVARPPQSADFVLVVAGPAALVLDTARQAHQRLGLRRPIRTVGIDGPDADAQLRDERQAGFLAADVRLGEGGPAVVAVALDRSAVTGWNDDGPRRIVDRLQPDAVWGIADARWRTSDVRAMFAELPRTDAVAVVNAERTASPAALWELDLPVALLDGRPATPAAWTALLLDRLDTLA
jgi:hypothetical protein